MSFEHKPVMLTECIEGLSIHPEGTYMDCTLGGAGHSLEIAARLEGGMLICLDRDREALSAAALRLKRFEDRVRLVHSDFRRMGEVLDDLEIGTVNGILFDLGVSSHQLTTAERGFSYMQDAPLDMRMDQSSAQSAAEIVNNYDENELARILFEYGEEKFARRIASAIVSRRSGKRIETTGELAAIIQGAIPAGAAKKEKQHPAKRSFQALRIAVNDELSAVREAMEQSIRRLTPGGRLVVLTFHSLEDRIVKTAMKSAQRGCICPPGLPVCVCGKEPQVRLITRKAAAPIPEEVESNPRSRSAKLRVCEKIQTSQPKESV